MHESVIKIFNKVMPCFLLIVCLACNDDINLNATSDDQDRGSCNSEKTSFDGEKQEQAINKMAETLALLEKSLIEQEKRFEGMQQTVLKQAEERELAAKIILQSALRAAKAKKTIHDDRFFEDYYDSIKNAASRFFSDEKLFSSDQEIENAAVNLTLLIYLLFDDSNYTLDDSCLSEKPKEIKKYCIKPLYERFQEYVSVH